MAKSKQNAETKKGSNHLHNPYPSYYSDNTTDNKNVNTGRFLRDVYHFSSGAGVNLGDSDNGDYENGEIPPPEDSEENDNDNDNDIKSPHHPQINTTTTTKTTEGSETTETDYTTVLRTKEQTLVKTRAKQNQKKKKKSKLLYKTRTVTLPQNTLLGLRVPFDTTLAAGLDKKPVVPKVVRIGSVVDFSRGSATTDATGSSTGNNAYDAMQSLVLFPSITSSIRPTSVNTVSNTSRDGFASGGSKFMVLGERVKERDSDEGGAVLEVGVGGGVGEVG